MTGSGVSLLAAKVAGGCSDAVASVELLAGGPPVGLLLGQSVLLLDLLLSCSGRVLLVPRLHGSVAGLPLPLSGDSALLSLLLLRLSSDNASPGAPSPHLPPT